MSDHTTTGCISPFDYDGAVATVAALEAACADLRARVDALEVEAAAGRAQVVELKAAMVNAQRALALGRALSRQVATTAATAGEGDIDPADAMFRQHQAMKGGDA